MSIVEKVQSILSHKIAESPNHPVEYDPFHIIDSRASQQAFDQFRARHKKTASQRIKENAERLNQLKHVINMYPVQEKEHLLYADFLVNETCELVKTLCPAITQEIDTIVKNFIITIPHHLIFTFYEENEIETFVYNAKNAQFSHWNTEGYDLFLVSLNRDQKKLDHQHLLRIGIMSHEIGHAVFSRYLGIDEEIPFHKNLNYSNTTILQALTECAAFST
jgi:hypothetical protein